MSKGDNYMTVMELMHDAPIKLREKLIPSRRIIEPKVLPLIPNTFRIMDRLVKERGRGHIAPGYYIKPLGNGKWIGDCLVGAVLLEMGLTWKDFMPTYLGGYGLFSINGSGIDQLRRFIDFNKIDGYAAATEMEQKRFMAILSQAQTLNDSGQPWGSIQRLLKSEYSHYL